jgi:hypothetical protein
MKNISPILKLLIAIPVIVMFLCSGVFFWQYRFRDKSIIQSDQLTIWMLEGLLIIAVISMTIFLFTVLR